MAPNIRTVPPSWLSSLQLHKVARSMKSNPLMTSSMPDSSYVKLFYKIYRPLLLTVDILKGNSLKEIWLVLRGRELLVQL